MTLAALRDLSRLGLRLCLFCWCFSGAPVGAEGRRSGPELRTLPCRWAT